MNIRIYRRYLAWLILAITGVCMMIALSLFTLRFQAKAQSFDRKAMLENIAQVFFSCHQAFAKTTETLNQAAQTFVNLPSEETLELAQVAWKEAGYAWSQCEFYEIGGLEVMILHNQINKAPNALQIDEALASEVVLDSAFIESKGSTMKGLATLELFLFSSEGNQSILQSFTDPRRRDYLKALGENVQQKASELVNYWSPEGKNYMDTFAAADQADGSVKGSINMLVNELINSLEKVAREKIYNPLGDVSSDERKPEIAEAYLSKTSLDRIKGNIISGQHMFTGGQGQGVDDYLVFLGAVKLSGQITDQFEATLEALDQINETFEDALVNHPERVSQAYNAVKNLLILISVDAANQLGITVTFNDSDGD
jgi:uncharacterized protein